MFQSKIQLSLESLVTYVSVNKNFSQFTSYFVNYLRLQVVMKWIVEMLDAIVDVMVVRKQRPWC